MYIYITCPNSLTENQTNKTIPILKKDTANLRQNVWLNGTLFAKIFNKTPHQNPDNQEFLEHFESKKKN